jgi:putative PEP-CTERM system TPR-repeat lipoprotein
MLTLLSCSSPKDNAELLQEAETFILEDKTPSAVISLKNILQNDPNHSKARYLLGKIYSDADNFKNAEKELQRSIEANPSNKKAILLLAKVQLSLTKFEDLLVILDNVDFDEDNDKVFALLLITQANLSLNRFDIAKNTIDKASNINSKSSHTLLGKALIASYESNEIEALSFLSTLLAQDKKYAQAWLLKGSVYSKQKKYKKSAEAYLEYYYLKPQNFGIRILAAYNLIKASEFELAAPHITDLLKSNEEHPTVNTLAAQLSFIDKDYSRAKELADRASMNNSNSLAQLISGLSSFYLNNFEQAYYQLSAISDALPKDHQAHKILAITQIKLGYSDEMNETLQGVENFSSDDASLFAGMGLELAQQGNEKDAAKMFSRAIDLAPKNAKIIAQRGLLKIFNGDLTGIDDLQKSLVLEPTLKSANITLTMTYLKQGQIEEATNIANKWLQLEPDNVAAILLNGNVALKSSRNDDAISFFQQARKLDPSNPTPIFNLAVIHFEDQKYNLSNEFIEKVLAIDIEYAFAYRLAIQNAIALNKETELEEKLNQILSENPDSIWPRLILARRYTVKGLYVKAIKTLETITNYSNLPQAFFIASIDAYIKNDQQEYLDTFFKKWRKAQPNNIEAYVLQIDILEKKQNYLDALALTREGLSQENLRTNFRLLSLEAHYLIATLQAESAARKVAHLASIKPEHAFLLRLQGQIALSRNQYEPAVDYLTRSNASNKNTITGLYLVTAYRNLQKESEAITFLESELANNPKNVAYERILAELYIASSPDKAITKYKEIIVNNANDILALNNLAWVLYQKDQLPEALKYAKQALALVPDHPQILDTVGVILLKQNNLAESIVSLRKANKMAPTDKDILLHLAQAYNQNGEKDKAKEIVNSFSDEEKEKWKTEIKTINS